MKKQRKKCRAALERLEAGRKYGLDEAAQKIKEVAFAKFDETVELTIWLGVDPRKADQLVRGRMILTRGLGHGKKVLERSQGRKRKGAEEWGAGMVWGARM